MCSVKCAVNIAQCVFLQCAVFSVQFAVARVQCAVSNVQCEVYRVQCVMCSEQCAGFIVLYAMFYDLCILCSCNGVCSTR